MTPQGDQHALLAVHKSFPRPNGWVLVKRVCKSEVSLEDQLSTAAPTPSEKPRPRAFSPRIPRALSALLSSKYMQSPRIAAISFSDSHLSLAVSAFTTRVRAVDERITSGRPMIEQENGVVIK